MDQWQVSCIASTCKLRGRAQVRDKNFTLVGIAIAFLLLLSQSGIAASVSTHTLNSKSSKNQKVSESARTRRRMKRLARGRAHGRVLYTSHQLGTYPDEEIPSKLGGVGKMCSFGEGVSMTPLQLGALVSAIANGGTLYYLQHLTTADDVANFQPRVKRHLDIAALIPELSDGMAGAVTYGTARSVRLNFNEEEILGKTGTCSKAGTRYGWFASYAKTDVGRIVTVVFLQGGRPTYGPKAAEIAGHLYRNLYDHDFFVVRPIAPTNTADVKTVGTVQ